MKKELLNKVIYQVYVRNFTKAGTIKALIKKLDYIKSLNVDIVYLLPIHEIGQKGKKGTLGCPYSIKDYYSIASELGTLADFKKLIKEIHKRDMKIMMDIVFNHTSRDSLLLNEHPEWFYKNKEGNFGGKVGEWSDVYDLDHSKPELEEYLSDNVKYWADLGVDGFRFDVASIIPISFYKLLREKISEDVILLAESVHLPFIKYLRQINADSATDSELYQYFDLCYNYDIWDFIEKYYKNHSYENKRTLEYILNFQSSFLPTKAMKINHLENHDMQRVASYFKGNALENITALSFFLKGTGFVYAGQEFKAKHLPSLFEKEPISHKIKDQNFHDLIKRCIEFKHNEFNKNLIHTELGLLDDKDVFVTKNLYPDMELYGIFNVSNKAKEIEIKSIPNGKYINLLNGSEVVIENSIIIAYSPMILKRA